MVSKYFKNIIIKKIQLQFMIRKSIVFCEVIIDYKKEN